MLRLSRIFVDLADDFRLQRRRNEDFSVLFGGCFDFLPGMATEPVRMTRALSQMRAPRSATLGILIAMSFMPLLKTEIKRVREAMKTRNAGSVLNPPVFYRAFLVPFAMRLVSVSDTLALSVETRGFTIGKEPYTIYKKENFVFSDFLFLFGLTASAAVTAVL